MNNQTIKDLALKVKQFNKYYEARLNVKNELQEAFHVLSALRGKRVKIESKQTIKLLSKEFNEMLVKELKSIQKKLDKDLHAEKISLFCEVVKFAWEHPERSEKLIINKSIETVDFGDQGDKDMAVFTFSGELGEIINEISDFRETEIFSFNTLNAEVELNNQMSFNQVREILSENFVVDWEQDYFLDEFKIK